MESNRKYSAGLMSQSFWFVEFRQYLRLKKENISYDEIKRRITEENLFGAPNECRAHRIGNYLSARVSRLSHEEVMLFFACDITSQKLMNLICIMRQDRLLFEFINEVYREKVMLGSETIDLSDGRAFFTEKEKQGNRIDGKCGNCKIPGNQRKQNRSNRNRKGKPCAAGETAKKVHDGPHGRIFLLL